MTACMEIVARRSRLLKCSRSRASSSVVGRRVRFLGLPIRRSSPQAERACWTISGLTGSVPDALGGPQNNAYPDQVVDHCCWSGTGTLRTTRLHMPNKVGGCEGECSALAERMLLQELQMGLFASLPARNGFKGVDVPADQLRERRCAVPQASQRRSIFECDFAMLCPAQRRRAMRKGPALLMQHGRAAAAANNRRIARRTVRLFAYFDRRHDVFEGT
jgi:hypothetical protein